MTAPSAPLPVEDAAASLPSPGRTPARRVSSWLYPRRGAQLRLLLAAPLGGSPSSTSARSVVLLLNAFWAKDEFTGSVIPFDWRLEAFSTLWSTSRSTATIAIRTVGMAALVTITDALLAFPIAYYMARIASPRTRGLLVIAVLMPLWAAYLIKVYAWRTILQGNGFIEWIATPLGIPGARARRARQLPGSCCPTCGCRT